MPKLTVVIPHKHEAENDKALAQALACLVANTRSDYELLIDSTTPADPYVVLNSMAERATGEYLAFLNSDTFVSPGWDIAMLEDATPDAITNMTLVEPGAIGVHQGNIHVDFGMTPETFRRWDFEAWCATNPALPNNDGFVYYAVIQRQAFLDFGGFDTSKGSFPTPLDSIFWQAWRDASKPIKRGRGLVYHLQNYSNPAEQQKSVRRWQPEDDRIQIPFQPAASPTTQADISQLFGGRR